MIKGFEPAQKLGGLTPWACQYTDHKGRVMAIVLYGDNPDQIEHDHSATYPDFTVLGELIGTAPEK